MSSWSVSGGHSGSLENWFFWLSSIESFGVSLCLCVRVLPINVSLSVIYITNVKEKKRNIYELTVNLTTIAGI